MEGERAQAGRVALQRTLGILAIEVGRIGVAGANDALISGDDDLRLGQIPRCWPP